MPQRHIVEYIHNSAYHFVGEVLVEPEGVRKFDILSLGIFHQHTCAWDRAFTEKYKKISMWTKNKDNSLSNEGTDGIVAKE